MPVDDLARSEVVTAEETTPVTELAATMAEEGVGSIVITTDETPVGIVTDRDLALRVVGESADAASQTAADVMTGDPQTVERDAGLHEATRLMQEHGIRRLPVCEGETLVGIITDDDITELLADEQGQLADVIRAQRPAY
jgi:CBS domain-containing protein